MTIYLNIPLFINGIMPSSDKMYFFFFKLYSVCIIRISSNNTICYIYYYF